MAILNNSNAISAGGYDVNNSLRFRSSASAYLNRTFSTNGTSQTKNSFSFWVKRGFLGVTSLLFEGYDGSSSNGGYIRFDSSDVLSYGFGGASVNLVSTTQVFRDPSAWYHIVIAVDTTQATASNRIKFYVNGSQVTTFGTANYPSQNATVQIFNSGYQSRIGRSNFGGGDNFDGYLADVNFIDGQALTPSDFGETDTTTGVWKPKAYTGTYGTNGFYLKFSDIATTSGSNAGLGKDFSGNTNYWTTNNISVTSGTTYDAMIDSPTLTSATVGNYAVMNPLELGDGAPAALSNGNLTITGSSTLYLRRGTMNFPLTGKYYCEFTISAVGSGVSIAYDSRGQNGATQFIQYNNDGTKNINGTSTSYGSSFTTNDVIALAVDADGGNVYFYKNNTSQGAISFSSASMTGVNATSMVFAYTSAIVNANFGQRPFAYTPPTGFVALNTFNLPTPTILQGNRFMDATLYVGNNTTNVIVNQARFQPDFIWIKNRSTVVNHRLFDSVRGVTKALFSSSTAAETTESDSLTAINSNGFTLGADNVGGGVNYSVGNNYVGWQWQAGQGSTSSNTNGSITTTTSVNTTAGFSIIRFTGTQANATIGHGLGVAPRMVIVKTYGGGTRGWRVYHASVGNTGYLILNDTAATTTDSTAWNNTTPTSTVISLGANGETNNGGSLMIAYAWAEIAGFSRINSYTGNGNADGPFVYTGFRPKFILYKNASYAGTSWAMLDSSRNTYNVLNARLFSDSSSAEDTSVSPMDFTSNGFKVRSTNDGVNRNGDTIIYMAFAESPFKNSLAR